MRFGDHAHYRILIVGAGLAGLALARALGQAGFRPELIEGQASWEVAGTGMYLPANGDPCGADRAGR
jgi:FAD-dependent urate hydroxylase